MIPNMATISLFLLVLAVAQIFAQLFVNWPIGCVIVLLNNCRCSEGYHDMLLLLFDDYHIVGVHNSIKLSGNAITPKLDLTIPDDEIISILSEPDGAVMRAIKNGGIQVCARYGVLIDHPREEVFGDNDK